MCHNRPHPGASFVIASREISTHNRPPKRAATRCIHLLLCSPEFSPHPRSFHSSPAQLHPVFNPFLSTSIILSACSGTASRAVDVRHAFALLGTFLLPDDLSTLESRPQPKALCSCHFSCLRLSASGRLCLPGTCISNPVHMYLMPSACLRCETIKRSLTATVLQAEVTIQTRSRSPPRLIPISFPV
jgi:hypothetical protein